MPADEVANDILILVVETENDPIALTTPNGFVEVTNSPQSAGTLDTNPANRIGVYWKRAVGSDSAPVVTANTNHTTCRIHAFVGVKTSGNPWNITAGGNDGGVNDTSAVIPGATTTAIDSLVVLVQGTSNNANSTANCGAATNADLANITERTDNSDTAGLGGGHCLITGEKATAGAYTNTTLTMSATTFKGAMSIALGGAPASPAFSQNIRKPAYFETNGLAHTNHPRYRGVVGHWILNESGGLTAYDLSGRGNRGALTGSPTWSQGQFGPNLRFNGTNNAVDTTELTTIVDDLTVVAQMNLTDSAAYESILGGCNDPAGDNCTGQDYDLIVVRKDNDNKITFVIEYFRSGSGGLIYTSTAIASLGPSLHLAFSFKASDDDAGALMYVNAQSVARTRTVEGTLSKSSISVPLSIGALAVGNNTLTTHISQWFNSAIEEVRIYNRALSPDEIMSLYLDPFLEFYNPMDDAF